VVVSRKSGTDRHIEKLLGLPAGKFSAALSRGPAPELSSKEREMARLMNCDEREFAARLARSRERLSFHSKYSVALPQGGSAPDWIELMPLGTFSGQDGRGPFRADGPAVIAATKANGLANGLPIDYDHRSFFGDPDSRAAGWIRELRITGDKLQGRVEWTPQGAAAVKSKEYRFLSPVFRLEPDDPDAPEDEQAGRVMWIRGAALTNNPNLSQLRPLTKE
jgi:Mu-like prophage I protein